MKMSINQFISFLLILFSTSLYAQKPTRIFYTGDPIKITLGVNAEQRVSFPDAKIVWADISDKVKDKLTTQIVNNEVYFKAKDAFKELRVDIGEEGSRKVYLLDITASQKKVGTRRIVITDGKDAYAVSTKKKTKPETVIPALKNIRTPSAGYKTLMQCAVREVYAPDRLRKCQVGIHKQSVNSRYVRNLMRFNETTTRPVGAWRSGGLHVTAIEVSNNTSNTLTLDPRDIRGRWKSRLFYKNRLTHKGHRRDSTTLFLISKTSFDEVVKSNKMIRR